jgi:hypothetical protein
LVKFFVLPIVTDDLESLLNFVSINFFMAGNSKRIVVGVAKVLM